MSQGVKLLSYLCPLRIDFSAIFLGGIMTCTKVRRQLNIYFRDNIL